MPITKLADIFEGNNDRHPYLILELSDGTTATVRAGNLEDVLLWRYTLTIPGRPAQEETGSKELGWFGKSIPRQVHFRVTQKLDG